MTRLDGRVAVVAGGSRGIGRAVAEALAGARYPAGKGGVTSLTYALAAELVEHGVRANVVCPRARTRLSTGPEYEQHIEALHDRGLLDDASYAGAQDSGPPEHAAALYLFLVSDLAAGITGQVFAAAGGFLGRFPTPTPDLLAWRDTGTTRRARPRRSPRSSTRDADPTHRRPARPRPSARSAMIRTSRAAHRWPTAPSRGDTPWD